MCRMVVGLAAREDQLTIACEARDAAEGLLKTIENRSEWPAGPLTLDLWAPDPPLIFNSRAVVSLTVDRCAAARAALTAGNDATRATPGSLDGARA